MVNNNCESSVLIDKEIVVNMERGIHQIKYECDHVFTVTRRHTWTQKQSVCNRTERTHFLIESNGNKWKTKKEKKIIGE